MVVAVRACESCRNGLESPGDPVERVQARARPSATDTCPGPRRLAALREQKGFLFQRRAVRLEIQATGY